ncbi:MAG: helix-turn-helix transcriptional regulator, partial [Pseudonocardia sp.]
VAARAAGDEAERLVAGLDERALARRMDAVAWLGWAHWFVERFAQAEATFTLGRDVTRRRGLGYVLPELLAGRALTLVHRGRLDEAAREAADARDAAELTGSGLALAMAAMTLADVAVLRGEHHLATAHAREALAVIDAGDRAARVLCSPALAEAELGAGDAAAARAILMDECGGPDLAHVERAWHPRMYEILTLAALGSGDVAAARGWAGRAEASAAGLGLAGRTATARRAHAAVLLAAPGDGERAAAAALEAVELFEVIGSPVEAARARVLAGRALAATGRAEDAARLLGAAEASAAAAGAAAVRVAADRAMRTLGLRRAGPDQLTAREREIAVLAAEGLTNRQIGAALVLSERTVEGHLGRARVKLGARSRAALGAALAASR